MTQRTYYEDDGPVWSWWGQPPADTVPEVPVDDVHTVRWGYNLADLDRLARIAACRAFGSYGSHIDRYEAAWDGTIELLLTATSRPNPKDLVEAGFGGVKQWTRQAGRGHTDSGEERSGYAAYWTTVAAPAPSMEDRVVDRVALWQIWDTLSISHRQALLAVAAARDYHQAADAMGVPYQSLHTRLSRARKEFQAQWYEGETPPRQRRTSLTVRARDAQGRRRITETQLEEIRGRHHTGERLKDIAPDYGTTVSTLSALLTGRRRPAPDTQATSDHADLDQEATNHG